MESNINLTIANINLAQQSTNPITINLLESLSISMAGRPSFNPQLHIQLHTSKGIIKNLTSCLESIHGDNSTLGPIDVIIANDTYNGVKGCYSYHVSGFR